MVASEIPSTMSLCVRSFLRSTISFCTTEIRAINPPNAVLPILRKLKNRDHREGPFIEGESFFQARGLSYPLSASRSPSHLSRSRNACDEVSLKPLTHIVFRRAAPLPVDSRATSA